LQRLFHHQGERAVAAAAAKYGTMFGVSSLGTVSLEELRGAHDTSQFISSISTRIEASTGQCCSARRTHASTL
jgi:isopentenyl diphosphate isomerase/L-lactate dehydrogenase-like FMN-dependent dehydrogenase